MEKAKELFRKLSLAFLVITYFTACNEEQEPTFYLELTSTACEVMAGKEISIGLTAHENTILKIDNPSLIEANYTWGNYGSSIASIQITGNKKGTTSIRITDNETNETATLSVQVTEYPMPKLAATQATGNIFDPMRFHLVTGDRFISNSELAIVYDSIIWTIKDEPGSFPIFHKESGEGFQGLILTLEWMQCFTLPGIYETRLTAWKDNEVVGDDCIEVTIANEKDFLLFNWEEIKKNSQAWEGHVNVLDNSSELYTTYGLNGTVPFVKVQAINAGFNKSYTLLYNYLCRLYSQPTYEAKTEKQQMFTKYRELFSEQGEYPNGYPCAIWTTEYANIVLLMIDNDEFRDRYIIYAEPPRQ